MKTQHSEAIIEAAHSMRDNGMKEIRETLALYSPHSDNSEWDRVFDFLDAAHVNLTLIALMALGAKDEK